MKFTVFLLAFVAVFFLSTGMVYAHDEDKTPEKVTAQTMSAAHDEDTADAVASQEMAQDFETIRDEVARSAAMIVIKALALALAVAGVALIYLRRNKGKEGAK